MPTPIPANGQGVIHGTFKIPANTFKAGTKQVVFKGDKGGHAETTFTGQGTVVTNTMRQVKNIQQAYYDPLAQTFILTEARQISAVDIWVEVKGTTELIVQLRETSVGFPTRTIIAEGRVDPANYTVGGWTRVHFNEPFYASANIEYAVVVLANDPTTEVAISELGKADKTSNTYVTQQPYQVGVLLSSANASTWTAHQDKDLTFRLVVRRYDPTKPKAITLGKITLAAGTTDLLISALTSTPATGADADLVLYQMDPNNPTDISKAITQRTVSDGQIVKFATPVSGDFWVVANLRCTEHASATIAPGTQIIQGIMALKADYVTRDIPGDKSNKVTVTVTLESNYGGVDVFYMDSKSGSALTPVAIPLERQTVNGAQVDGIPLANGRTEFKYKVDIQAAAAIDQMKLKLELNGTAARRPEVFNLRVAVV